MAGIGRPRSPARVGSVIVVGVIGAAAALADGTAIVRARAGIARMDRAVMAEAGARDDLAQPVAVGALPFELQALLAGILEIPDLEVMGSGRKIDRDLVFRRAMRPGAGDQLLAVEIERRPVIGGEIERVLARIDDVQVALVAGGEQIGRAPFPEGSRGPQVVDLGHAQFLGRLRGEVDLVDPRDPLGQDEVIDEQPGMLGHRLVGMGQGLAGDHAAHPGAVGPLPFQLQALLAAVLEVTHLDVMRAGLERQRDLAFGDLVVGIGQDHPLAVDEERRIVVGRQEEGVLARLRDVQIARVARGEGIGQAVLPERGIGVHVVERRGGAGSHGRPREVDLVEAADLLRQLEIGHIEAELSGGCWLAGAGAGVAGSATSGVWVSALPWTTLRAPPLSGPCHSSFRLCLPLFSK